MTRPSESKLSKYAEIIIGCLISLVLFGAVIYLIKDYNSRLSCIEHAMQKLLGANWNNQDYKLPNIEEINNHIICLDRQKFQALLQWAKAVDKNFIVNYSKPIIGYAHITDRLDNNEPKVLLNISNLYGACLEIGDKIEIINVESALNEKINAVVYAIYSDLQHTDVIIQVNHKVARTINFDPKRGKLKVKLIRLFDKDNRWHSLEDRLRAIMNSNKE